MTPSITTTDAKALAHPLRARIVDLLAAEGVSSPNMMATALDEPLGNVSYHVKTLFEYEWVQLVRTEPRRGAVEHFYSLTDRAQVRADDIFVLDKVAELVLPGEGHAESLMAEIQSLIESSGRTVDTRKGKGWH